MDRKKLFPTPQIEAWARLLQVQKVLVERVQKELAAADLPPLEWYDVLLALSACPEGRMRLHKLSDWTALSRSNLTRLCDRLEDDGLIERQQCAKDRRGQHARLTGRGHELMRRMWPVYRRALESHFARHYSAADAARLVALLARPLEGADALFADDAGARPKAQVS